MSVCLHGVGGFLAELAVRLLQGAALVAADADGLGVVRLALLDVAVDVLGVALGDGHLSLCDHDLVLDGHGWCGDGQAGDEAGDEGLGGERHIVGLKRENEDCAW